VDFPTDGARRILVADDDVSSVVSVGRLLQAHGYDVRAALTGLDALDSALAFRPDAALIDLALPLLDGCRVARLLRANPETRDARLIALTQRGTDVLAETLGAGFDLHLVKPVALDELLAALGPGTVAR
jgi:CheY-like chemotaxis protein